MARSFKSRYEELFGETPDYDPIKLGYDKSQKRALDIQASVPEIDASGGALESYPTPPKAIDPEQGIGGNLADLTKTGTALMGEAVVGVGEYASRQATRLTDDSSVAREVLSDVTSGLEATRGRLSAYRQSIYDMMPADAIRMKGAEFLTLDPDKTIWQGGPGEVGEAILYKFWESLPMMAGTIIPGAVMMRAGASAGGLAYLGASEAGLSVGFIANEITDGINEMDDETLAQESERFAALLQELGTPQAARDQLIAEAQSLAPLIGGALVGAVSYTAGRYLEPIITGKVGLGFGQRAARGAVSEGIIQEGPQESFETIAANYAAAVYDGDRQLMEGVAESYVQGAVVGAPAGAVVAGVVGTGQDPDATPEGETPTARDRPGAPSSFRDVFGEQVPPEGGYTGAPGDMFGPDDTLDVSDDPTDPAAAAAVSAALRVDNKMDDMVDNIASQTPEARQQENLDLRGGEMTQYSDSTDFTMPTPGFEDVMGPNEPGPMQPPPAPPPAGGAPFPTGQQGELFEQPQGAAPPLTPPPAPAGPTAGELGVTPTDGFVVTMTDDSGAVIEEDIFATAEEAGVVADQWASQIPDAFINVTRSKGRRTQQGPAALDQATADQPTAEPLADIQAQLEDMAHEATSREAVYLSADNVARIQRDNLADQLPQVGIPMPNFDGKGGMLIVRDEEVAQGAREMLELGMPMQEVLGQLTRAGAGKPMGDTVVQVRDDAGRVLRETLVASEEEAFALAESIGDSAVVLTSAQALKRREKLIADEQADVKTSREAERQQEIIREQLPAEERGPVEKVAGSRQRKTATRAAAGTIGVAAKRVSIEKQRSIGGFYPPDTMEFASAAAEADYRAAWSRLVDNQIAQEMAGTYPINRRADLKKEETKLFQAIGKVRQITKPTRKVTRVLKTAAKISPSTASTIQQDLSKEQGEIDTSQKDYFVGEQLEVRSRDQIDALEGGELTTAFADAVYWLAGQYRNVEIVPEFLGDNPDALDTDIADTIRKAGGDPLPALAASYSTPGQQKKLIRRVNIYAKRKEDGGKIAARGVTSAAKGERTTTSEFDTGVLTRKTEPQDESRSDVLKREARSKKAKKDLEVGVRQSTKLLQRLENKRSDYGKLVAERDSDGNPTKVGQNMRLARAYFVALNEFAISLLQSGQTTAESSAVMERLNKQLRDLGRLTPKTFANKVSRLARANEQSGLLTIADPKVRGQVTSPTERARSLARYYENLMGNIGRRLRLENVWKKNSFYNNLVGPLMNKFTDAIAVDGWASYRPNEAEANYLQYAMRGWRSDPSLKESFYDPMRQFFRGVGFEFDSKGDLIIHRDSKGKFQWSPNDEVLGKQLEKIIGKETQGSYESARFGQGNLTVGQFNAPRTADPTTGLTPNEVKAADTARRADAKVDDQQAAVLKGANRAINALLRIVSDKKSTIDKLVKAEQRFIRKMKELGVWADTKSPMIGRILVGTARRYHKIGLRLLQKKITKQEARAIMGRIKPFPQPKGVAKETFTVTEAQQELDMLQRLVGSENNDPALRATAQAIGDKLVRRDIAPSMSAILRTMLETLPENHYYRELAEKLLALNINDVNVQYDWDGSVFGTSSILGRFRVRRATGRNIFLNRSRLQSQLDVGADMAPMTVHTVLHEMVHAATHKAIAGNPGLEATVMRLRAVAREKLGDSFYGLKDGPHEADEFIAEAFSNPEFQAALKKVYLDGRTVWRKFTDMVRDVLGMPDNTPVSVMDAIMSLESQLFSKADPQTSGAIATLDMDMALQPAVSLALNRLEQGVGRMKGFWDSIKPPLIAMSMEQIRDTYEQYFGGSTGPLRKYMKAFFGRNAENTRLMERAEKLTRRWTALDEKYKNGDEFSAIATDVTMSGVAMAPKTDPRNAHLSANQKSLHTELYKRFKKLEPEYQKLYGELQTYYRETLENEVDLMNHNALRGLLKGEMTVKEFEAKYSVEKLKAFDTAEKFNAEFEQYLDKDMLSTLNQMTNVRQQRKGDYFPLKRYGDFVVYAETEIERKVFDDSKEAYAYAAERRASDITLDVSVKPQDNGSFRVKVMEKDFRTAETKTKAAQMRMDMEAQYGVGVPTPVQLKSTFSQDSSINSNAQLNSILQKLEGNKAAQAAIKQFYLESLSESSFRKHEMKRKNRRGVETDLQLRNFTVYAKQSSYYTAQLMFGSKMAEGMAEMSKFVREHTDETNITAVRLGEVFREVQKRDEMTTDLTEIAKFAKTSVEITQFMMLTSPSYWMINASQPWMVTLPYLNGKYGLGNSLAAMKQAQKLIIPELVNAVGESKGGLAALWSKAKAEKAFNVLDDVLEGIKRRDPANYKAYAEMLGELKQQGVIDLSWIAELRDISEGTNTGKWQKTLDASRVMAHLTEVNNRILTAIATYDLAKQAALDLKIDPATAHQVGIKEAKLAVSKTQFNYSSANKPRLFQGGGPLGPAGPMVFQFMQWPQHMYALMIQNMHQMSQGDPQMRREARKTLTGLFVTHLAAGGILGAALQPIKWAFGALAMVFGDEGEDTLKGAVSGETFDRAVTTLVTDMFGSEIGTAMAKGLPTLVGADLSARMSLGTVYYLNFRGDNAESALGSLALGLGGASVNLGANFGRGVQHFFEGNYRRAIESASPKILRDIIRTTRYWDEGLVNNAGDTVIASEGLSARDLFLQAMGVQPSVVSQFYGGQSAIKDKEIYFRERKSDILKDFRAAVGNSAAMAKVLRDVAKFNRNNPAIAITRSSLVQSVYGRKEREARYRRYGANIDEKAATIFAEEADPYR